MINKNILQFYIHKYIYIYTFEEEMKNLSSKFIGYNFSFDLNFQKIDTSLNKTSILIK